MEDLAPPTYPRGRLTPRKLRPLRAVACRFRKSVRTRAATYRNCRHHRIGCRNRDSGPGCSCRTGPDLRKRHLLAPPM
jgi:hypothetical protein